MRKLFKRQQAKRDIIELADYIAQDSPTAADQFLVAMEAAFRFVAQTPKAGAVRDYLNPSLTGLRIWPVRGFEKHLIFYREIPEGLEIVSNPAPVLHGCIRSNRVPPCGGTFTCTVKSIPGAGLHPPAQAGAHRKDGGCKPDPVLNACGCHPAAGPLPVL